MESVEKYGADKPLTAGEIRAQVNLIQEVMQSVMKEGHHFGKIPGAGDKPTLLKPGAEKIMATFRMAADPEVMDLSANGYIRYRVKCKMLSSSGLYLGAGVGEASTDEEKYKWRSIVSEEEWSATPETERRIKFKKPHQNQPTKIKQIRTNPADVANTVLKMAKKRALVDAVLTTVGASDIFTQDIEDLPEEIISREAKRAETKGKETHEELPKETKKAEDFLTIMARERQRIGDKNYLTILGNNGWESAEQIEDRKEQIKIYKIMVGYPPIDREPGSEG